MGLMARKRHVEWLDDYEKCSAWMNKYKQCTKLVKQGGGIAKISNFFPDYVAEGILSDLEKVPVQAWNNTEATPDLSYNNISHSFQSVREAKGLDRAVRALTLLRPGSLNSFSAAKYMATDHIAPHDDRAYTQVRMDDGSIIMTSRTLAVIVYLTKNWRQEDGGLLIDLEDPAGPRTYVPEFNSAILFTIPRWHQVTAMNTQRPRYTLFGWFLEPGELYPLNLGTETGPPTAAQTAKKKKKRKSVPAEEPGHEIEQQQRHAAGHPQHHLYPGLAAAPGGQCSKQHKKKRANMMEAGPAMAAPATAKPATAAPATAKPATAAPATAASATAKPATAAPATAKPATAKPATAVPGVRAAPSTSRSQPERLAGSSVLVPAPATGAAPPSDAKLSASDKPRLSKAQRKRLRLERERQRQTAGPA